MLAKGVDPSVIVLAVQSAELAMRHSTGIPVDRMAEKRRAWDRERKQRKLLSTGIPPESTGQPVYNTSLTSIDTKEVVKKEKKDIITRRIPIPPEFHPKPSHFKKAKDLALPDQYVWDQLEAMRNWAEAHGKRMIDWDAQLHTFLRTGIKDRNGASSNGFHAKPNDFKTALGKLRDSIRQDECGQAGGELPLGLLPGGGFQ